VSTARRILFVVRGKLGESVIPYCMVRAYAAARPQDEVSLLVRKDYARLLENEAGVRIIPFGSRLEMMARLLWLRLTEPAFDVLAVLWGFGNPVLRIAQLTRATRKIYLDGQYPMQYPEWPPHTEYDDLIDPAWFVTRVFAPDIAKPARLDIPSLSARRDAAPKPGVVAVVPAADEDRRTFDLLTLQHLLSAVAVLHPGRRIWLIVNPGDRGAREFLAARLPANVEVRRFSDLSGLLAILVQIDAYYGTDTGVFHLAAAMRIPATVLFGPTQPRKIVLPGQPNARWVRMTALGDAHCEIKNCTRPVCLYQCVASFAGSACATPIADTPAACPLRAFEAAELEAITQYQAPA
jgi:ADP-heptose:LPS heptosyltransferase